MNIQENKVQHRTIVFTSSLFHRYLVLTVHAFAVVAALLARLPLDYFWLVQVLIVWYLLWSTDHFIRGQQQYSPLSVKHCKGRWHLLLAPENKPLGVIVSNYYWTRYLVIVKYRPLQQPQRIRYLAFFWDMASQDDFRRFRVITRFYL